MVRSSPCEIKQVNTLYGEPTVQLFQPFRHSHLNPHSLHLIHHAPGKLLCVIIHRTRPGQCSGLLLHQLYSVASVFPSHPSFSSLVRPRLTCLYLLPTPDCRCRHPSRPDFLFLASAFYLIAQPPPSIDFAVFPKRKAIVASLSTSFPSLTTPVSRYHTSPLTPCRC